MTKVLLWNSMLGKVYSASDGYLDNGIALLQSALQNNGIEVIIEDPANIEFMDRFVRTDLPNQKEEFGYSSSELIHELNNLAPDIFFPRVPESEKKDAIQKWDTLQDILGKITQKKMDIYIDDLVEKSVKDGADIVGIKTWLGNRFTYSESLADKLASRSPETFVIAGGPQVNVFKNEALLGNKFDLGVYHQGENTLVLLANIIKAGKEKWLNKNEIMETIVNEANLGKIPNLIYRDSGEVKVSEKQLMPMRDKSYPVYNNQPGKVTIAVVEDGLGCYYRKGCEFCDHESALGGYRVQDLDHLIYQIKSLIKQDVGLFRLSSSATSSVRGSRIAERLLKEGIVMEYSMITRAEKNARTNYWDIVNRYETMIKAGLKGVFMGAEAANEVILDKVMEKGNSVDDMLYTVMAIKESAKKLDSHVDVGLRFIYPTPIPKDSTITHKQVLNDYVSFIKKLENAEVHIDSILITPPGFVPGSRWLGEKEKFDFNVSDNFLQLLLRYNYELGKDPKTWPDIPLQLGGIDWKDLLDLTAKFGRKIFDMGYPINLTDEHCLAARASGNLGKWGLVDFKARSDFAIFSTNYQYLIENYKKTIEYSKSVARANAFHPLFDNDGRISYQNSSGRLPRILEPSEAMSGSTEVEEYKHLTFGITHKFAIEDPFVFEAMNLGVNKGRVLDLACGNGTIGRLMLKKNNEYAVMGIDLSPEMIAKAIEINQAEGLSDRSGYLVGDISKLPYNSNCFDVIVCNHVFHHLPNERKMAKVLKEIQRVAKPDGAILIKDVCRPDTEEKLKEYQAKFGVIYPEGAQKDIYVNSIKAALNFNEWRNLFRSAGLLNGVGVEIKKVYNLGCPTHVSYVKTAIR